MDRFVILELDDGLFTIEDTELGNSFDNYFNTWEEANEYLQDFLLDEYENYFEWEEYIKEFK